MARVVIWASPMNLNGKYIIKHTSTRKQKLVHFTYINESLTLKGKDCILSISSPLSHINLARELFLISAN